MNKIDRPTGQRGVAYLRVSSDKQETTRQREAINRWAARHALMIESWFEDTGSRDLAAKRPEFQRLTAGRQRGDPRSISAGSQWTRRTVSAPGTPTSLASSSACSPSTAYFASFGLVAQGLLSATDDATVQ